MGSGQKLCRLEILISPAATASMMPGSRLMRVPWLNSAYSKPRSRISRNMARPSVWRWEFQQVESEYIDKGRMRPLRGPHSAGTFEGSHVRVAGAQHGGEAGGLHLATFALARFFKMPMIANHLQGPFAIDLFFQSPQGLFDRLAFF